jgi:hypothetical protein
MLDSGFLPVFIRFLMLALLWPGIKCPMYEAPTLCRSPPVALFFQSHEESEYSYQNTTFFYSSMRGLALAPFSKVLRLCLSWFGRPPHLHELQAVKYTRHHLSACSATRFIFHRGVMAPVSMYKLELEFHLRPHPDTGSLERVR